MIKRQGKGKQTKQVYILYIKLQSLLYKKYNIMVLSNTLNIILTVYKNYKITSMPKNILIYPLINRKYCLF